MPSGKTPERPIQSTRKRVNKWFNDLLLQEKIAAANREGKPPPASAPRSTAAGKRQRDEPMPSALPPSKRAVGIEKKIEQEIVQLTKQIKKLEEERASRQRQLEHISTGKLERATRALEKMGVSM